MRVIQLRFWQFIHNVIVHPLYGILPQVLYPVVNRLHDWTASFYPDTNINMDYK